MFSFKKKDNLKKVKKLTSILEDKLSNTPLLQKILERIYQAEKNNGINQISDFSISISDKENQEMYYLTINPNKIKIDLNTWDNHYQESTTISFDDNIVIVTVKKITSFASFYVGPIGVDKKVKISTYKDNQLVHVKESHSSITTSLENQLGSTTFTETFIDSNHRAFKREIATCENDGIHKSGVAFYKTDFFDAPTFYNPEIRSYKNKFKKSYEDEFNTFMKAINSERIILLKKKK